MIWEAAGESLECPVFDWMCSVSSCITDNIQFHENYLAASEAVTVGWTALRARSDRGECVAGKI